MAKKDEATEVSKDEVTVVWNNGSRVYSKSVHGENFKDLAEEFATKNVAKGAKVVK